MELNIKMEAGGVIWLIGEINEFFTVEVPTFGDILRCVFYHRNVYSTNKNKSCTDVGKKLVNHWDQFDKEHVAERDVVQRIKNLLDLYDSVRKGKHRRTSNQLNYEEKFSQIMNHAFDIAPKINYHHRNKHQDFTQMQSVDPTLVASNNIYDHQNKHHQLIPTTTDNIETGSINIQAVHRQIDFNHIKTAEIGDSIGMELDIVHCESDAIDSDEMEDDRDKDFEESLSPYYKSQFSINMLEEQSDDDVVYKIINSPDVSSALDRTNTSSGSFAIILAAIARVLEVDLTECVFSLSTLLRRREAHRETITTAVKDEFLASLKSGLVVHFDGKRLRDSTNDEKDERNGKVDRIAVVVTGLNIQKILSIAKSDDGTGLMLAEIVYEQLEAWSILDYVVGMCSDTTSANTGCYNGACVLFQKKLERNVIYLACRHHVLEIKIGAVYVLLFGETTGPFTPMFENFKRDWSQIDKTLFKPLDMKVFRKKYLKELRIDVISYIETVLTTKDKTFIPRGDYLEMMQLCLLVLGKPLPGYTFKLPHNCNNARWMGKIIYSLKIFLFRDQVNLAKSELANLEEFCIFSCLIYTKHWIQCCVPSNAPANDLHLLKSLNQYKQVNAKIANCAIEKFQDHLWYLGSELVVLSLFSDKVEDTVKTRMFENMKRLDDKQWTNRDYRLTFDKKIFKKDLSDLVGPSSMTVLKSLKINVDFMFQNEVNMWKQLAEYRKAKEIVDSFKVVNDTAERALKMMTDFNESLTFKEENKQQSIQVVEDNRKRIPNLTKTVLSGYTQRHIIDNDA